MAVNKNSILVISSRAPQLPLVSPCVKSTTAVYSYSYENSTAHDILVHGNNSQLSRLKVNGISVGVHQQLQGRKVQSMGLLLHSLETELFLCFAENRVISEKSTGEDEKIRSFFMHLAQSHLDPTRGRIDILNACLSPQCAAIVSENLQRLLQTTVGVWKDHFGPDMKIGNLYFNVENLKNKLHEVVSAEEQLDGYEKIRTVGKGAFGTAVLYKHIASDNLVVIKEINMMELTANERQMALNEVQVLSVLNHLNIVSYHRSFERDGVLMIEMEYADGGTLAQLLARQSRPMPERDILPMFSQIVAAIRHMHQHNILHRDLKTANVFLTKENVIKVGDFGISKAMTTKAQAQTVLGTPYYISPEMCEGKQYDQKSDIWALGCILYEMACLKKPFQGSSLPALVNSIMKGNFQPVQGQYSPTFRQIVNQILQRDPHLRPTAADLLENTIPRAMDLLNKQDKQWLPDQMDSVSSIGRNSRERSVLYELKGFNNSISLIPLQTPPQIRIKQVAVSNTHYIILTQELTVLTWGEGTVGQLGHGDTPAWRSSPTPVLAVGDRSVRMVGAGDGFSVFVSDSGMLMTCGQGSFGCLGHSDWNNLSKPKLIEKLLQVDVTAISCGARHVVVLAADCDMYSWGQGDGGRLGLGHERDTCTPTLVTLPERIVVRNVYCGVDSTFAVSSNGSLMACGRNTYNKLGLSHKSLFFSNKVIEKSLFFQKVESVTRPIVDVSLASGHACLLTDDGHVLTMGRNNEAQLGQTGPKQITKLSDIVITSVVAGPTFSAATSLENVIFFWGTTRSETLDKSNKSQYNSSGFGNNFEEEVVKEPKEVIALYASQQQLSKGNSLTLGGIFAMPSSLLVLVHTTCPLAKKYPAENSSSSIPTALIADHDGDTDSLGPLPDWIRADIADSEAQWSGFTNSTIMPQNYT